MKIKPDIDIKSVFKVYFIFSLLLVGALALSKKNSPKRYANIELSEKKNIKTLKTTIKELYEN